MDTELNNKDNKLKVFKTTAIICLIAVVLSFAGCGTSDKSAGGKAPSVHSTTIVKGSEGIKPICFGWSGLG